MSSVRSSQSSRRYYQSTAELSPYKSVKSSKVRSTTPTPNNSTSRFSQQESPRFSNTFKEARRAVCDLYTIWRHEYDEKQQPSSSNQKDKASSKQRRYDSRSEDGKLELSSNAVEYLEETIRQLTEETNYFQVNMEAFHKGMMSLMDKKKGSIDTESINKKSLREKGVPLADLKNSRTEKLASSQQTNTVDLEKKLVDVEKKYSDVVAQLCEAQNMISKKDLDLKHFQLEVEERIKLEDALNAKCESLKRELEEEANRSSEALVEMQRSHGSKDEKIESLIESMQSRLDSKVKQCNELQDDVMRYELEQSASKEEISNLKKEMQRKEEETGKKLELTLSDVQKLSKEYKELKDSIDVEEDETSKKLRNALETIDRQASECDKLKGALVDAERKTKETLERLDDTENEVVLLREKTENYTSMQRDVEEKIKEMQGLNENLSSTLSEIDGAKHLASILSKDINKGLQNYLDDILEAKTPRNISDSENPFGRAVDTEDVKPKKVQSLDTILGSNGMARDTQVRESEGKAESLEVQKYLSSILSDLGVAGDEAKSSKDLARDIKSEIEDLVQSLDKVKSDLRQQETDYNNSEQNNKDLQSKLLRVQSELEDLKFHPEVSIGSAVASPSRSRSHTVDNAVFKEHSSISELPEMEIREDEDIAFSSSDDEEGDNDSQSTLSFRQRGSKSMFQRQNSKQIAEGIAEDLRVENDSLKIKLTQAELENEQLNRKLKEKEKELGKQTTREMETIRRASAVYDTKVHQGGQKGFWQGKRKNSNSEEMQTLVSDLTARYSDISLKFAEKCSELDEMKHELKKKDIELGAIREQYAIPGILEQNNNVWVSFRVFIPGDDEKGVPTCLLIGTDGLYIPQWMDQQFYDYTIIAKFEVRDNEFAFWALTPNSRKLNEVNLYCNAVLPSAILASIQSAIKVKLEVHNTATSSIQVVNNSQNSS